MNLSLNKEKIDWHKILFLVLILVFIGSVVFYDYSRLKKDFRNVRSLLADVRSRAIKENRDITAQFFEKGLVIKDNISGRIHDELEIPTLQSVNYDTTLGKDMIVFTGRGTARYNVRVHGGDLTLKSWFGFQKHIAVNCTGFVREGTYPDE